MIDIQKYQRAGVHILTRDDARYPEKLSTIEYPPDPLFVKGNVEAVNNTGIAIVGMLEASKAGQAIAYRMAAFFAEQGYTIVSGLALGIDAAAHEGALSVGGQTVCVLAGGLKEAAPRQNAGLADRILASGGAWVSEKELDIQPDRSMFVPRNRIQVGLSACSIVVECNARSGTMTHAQYCVAAGHPLFAVAPEDEDNKLGLSCDGPRVMIERMGAQPVVSKVCYQRILSSIKGI
ncbi:DNA-processing protein DprA [Sinobacterium caligoides]|uniref:DNA-processing protein DprA n=1 Tax=Sinobacterium caligoides TaxID=933926 RepID=UPI0013C2E790|nr:DNA-processing protein DprA [Sinobacterium caligoides]